MDRERCAAVPEDIEFATKPRLAQRMIERALTAGVPVSWVLGDEVYGNGCASGWNSTSGPLCWRSRRRCGRWSPARGRSRCRPRIGRTSGGLAPPERRGEGRASVRLGAVPAVPPAAGAHWLLVRRTIAKPDAMAYYVVFGPAAPRLEALARIAGRRWPVEECFETAKQAVGLDGYEVRSWHGWDRHITLSMRLPGGDAGRTRLPKGGGRSSAFIAFSMPEIRRLITRFQVSSASTSFSHARSGVGSIRPSPKPATGNDRPPNS
jgi:SRSO17 transposase